MARASRPSCSCRPGRSSIRALEAADPLPRPALAGRHVRRTRQRPLGPADRPRGVPGGGIRRGRARGDGRDRNGARGRWSRLSRGAERSLHPRRRSPRAGAGDGLHRSGRAAGARRASGGREPGVPGARTTRTTAGGSSTATTGSSTTKTSSSSSSRQCFTEPHSTKPHEDTVGWGLETDAPTLVATQLAPRLRTEADVRALLSRIDCPILVIHGSDDHVRPCASGARLAELANGALVVLDGAATSPTPATRSRSTCCSGTSSTRSAGTAMTATRQAPRLRGDPCRGRRPGRAAHRARRRPVADGVRIAYEVYGSGEPTIVLLPSSPIVHSRQWKGQVPYLSRTHRVVVFDGRGNGRSDRPTDPDAYREPEALGDIEAVMDATGTDSRGPDRAVRRRRLAVDRVRGAPSPSGSIGIVAFAAGRPAPRSAAPVEGRQLVRRRAGDRRRLGEAEPPLLAARLPRLRPLLLRGDHLGTAFDEADRGRRRVGPRRIGRRDARRHGRRADRRTRATVEATCRAVTCPMLIVHGTEDTCQPHRAIAPAVRADRCAARRGRGRRPHDPGPAPGARQPADP